MTTVPLSAQGALLEKDFSSSSSSEAESEPEQPESSSLALWWPLAFHVGERRTGGFLVRFCAADLRLIAKDGPQTEFF